MEISAIVRERKKITLNSSEIGNGFKRVWDIPVGTTEIGYTYNNHNNKILEVEYYRKSEKVVEYDDDRRYTKYHHADATIFTTKLTLMKYLFDKTQIDIKDQKKKMGKLATKLTRIKEAVDILGGREMEWW